MPTPRRAKVYADMVAIMNGISLDLPERLTPDRHSQLCRDLTRLESLATDLRRAYALDLADDVRANRRSSD